MIVLINGVINLLICKLNSLLSSLIIEDFSLSSGWEKYGIQIRRYYHNLKKITLGTIYTLKIKELNKKIKNIEIKIAETNNDDQILNDLIKLQKARAQMAKSIGRFYLN